MDTRVRLLVNVTSYGGEVGLITVTAPGKDKLPDLDAIHAFNQAAPQTWREANRAARQFTIRHLGIKPTTLAWSWELQKRQALHKHVVMGLGTAKEKRAAHVYALALERELKKRGWGWADGGHRSGKWRSAGLKALDPSRGARYLAKYLTPLDSATGKAGVTATVLHRDVPPMVVYVSRERTNATGVTMRSLRHRRVCWVLGFDPKTGELYERGRPVSAREPTASPSALAEPRGP